MSLCQSMFSLPAKTAARENLPHCSAPICDWKEQKYNFCPTETLYFLKTKDYYTSIKM